MVPLADAVSGLSDHPSLSEAVYRRLLAKVIGGELSPGLRLREERLCADLGVSRTPLREALIRLVREGVLEQQPRRGCRVRTPSENELADLMEARGLLEGAILRAWFERLDRARCRDLERRLRAAPSKGRAAHAAELLAVDEALHGIILASCPNRVLVEQVERLVLRCRPWRVYRIEENVDREGMGEERLTILRAILAGEPAKAEKALKRHFEISGEYFGKPDAGEGMKSP